jgi:regulator of sigma E protease
MEFLNTIGGLLIFIIILGLIIAVHEGGHFFFARRAGILAREFAFGMGPILWKKKKGETLYSVRAFPIGGFCAIAGEELEDDPFKEHPRVKLDVQNGVIHNFYLNVEDESLDFPVYDIMEYDLYDEAQTGNLYMEVIKDGERFRFAVKPDAVVYMPKFEYQIAPYNRTLGSKSKRARAMVMFGGPLMNFLLALIVFLLAGMISGRPTYEDSTFIPIETRAAEASGLKAKDKIIKLEASDVSLQEVGKWNDISKFMDNYTKAGSKSKIVVTYLRDGKEAVTEVLPNISINSLALDMLAVDEGLKVTGYTSGSDGMVDNTALEPYYYVDTKDHKKGIKELIITEFEYDGIKYPATDLKKVYELFNNYTGDKPIKADNQVNIRFTSNGVAGSVKVIPYGKAIMDYQFKQNGIERIKVSMGVSPNTVFDLWYSIKYTFERTINSGTAVFSTLGMLFRGDVPLRALSGFVGIAKATVSVAGAGLIAILNWTGLLSVNIGLMNLLPIPALDGGRLVFLGYEAITRKKPNKKVETWLITTTMLLLFALMIYVTINDIFK